MEQINNVSIAIQPSVYRTLRDITNDVWYVLGEFVDNAVQSYIKNKERLLLIESDFQLTVNISIDRERKRMEIIDNAAGINAADYIRAFKLAEKPDDTSGLNRFGMGMKTASVWLADDWCVYTKALGEDVERYIHFDLNKVVEEQKHELEVLSSSKPLEEHYTKVILSNLSERAPKVMQMSKVCRHLSSIYRNFIRTGELKLIVDGVELTYTDPEILSVPYYKNPEGVDVFWKKEIDFKAGKYQAKGFIGILKTMSTSDNGFALFENGRVIQGSGSEDKYRPKFLCGNDGTPRYKRLFGELELGGFDVSFNKNKFQDDGSLDEFFLMLKDEISAPELDIYGQAENYRIKTKEDNTKLAKQIAKTLKKESQPRQLTQKVEDTIKNIQIIQEQPQNKTSIDPKIQTLDSHEETFTANGEIYTLKVELIDEPTHTDLYKIGILEDDLFAGKTVKYAINLAHPFFYRFEKFKKDGDYQPIIEIIKALTIAEIIAPSQGVKDAGVIRMIFNEYLLQ